MVRPAGIKPATYSLEVRSGHTRHNKFKTLSVQDTARCILFIPIDAPPALYLFTLADPKASLAQRLPAYTSDTTSTSLCHGILIGLIRVRNLQMSSLFWTQ